ncbi:MAG TPA: HAMP domain-containing sensor histidine kinase [Anaeromyxobacter sp.]|nr:HAMP domain-containing sensor histidine kinase [Anaeromyxobacter sp.]
MGDEGLHRAQAPAPSEGARALAEALGRLLGIDPDERAPRRLAGALVDAVPAADFAAVVVRADGGGRLELAAAVGLDDGAAPSAGALAEEAIGARALRVAASPGAPFPPGTRAGAAAAGVAGETACALLLGSRSADAFADEALVLLRAAADRAALALECARLARESAHQGEIAARAEADIASRRKAVDYVLGIVGHDLRNPLGAIHMSAALLQKRGGLAGWQAQTVDRMRSSAGRMARIIADLLSYTRTRLGSGLPIARRPARLDEIVARVVDELRAANAGREIVIATEGDLSGEWDPDRLEQVASNLVSNAVDHGDPRAPVRVELAGEPDAVVLRVRNDGPSLPPEVLAHLFEPFSRGPDEKSRKASGLGLGLYISREIVRGHGGEIGAVSDGETVVTVRLPRRPAGS